MPTTLVTGASSGIGAAFARALAGRGHDIVLVARRADRLQSLKTELEAAHGVAVTVLPADLTAPDAAQRLATALAEREISLDGLVNNAGSCVYDAFDAMSDEAIAGMIALNVRALTTLTRRFTPALSERRGFVLNVASAAAYVPMPYGAVYAATKAYVLAFSEALHEELAPRVRVLAVCPGSTESEIHGHAGTATWLLDMSGMMTAEAVVEEALGALDRGEAAHMPGAHNRLIAAFTGTLPRPWLTRLTGALFKPSPPVTGP